MKIAFIIPSLANKGPIIMVHDLITHLEKQKDHQCEVYFFDDISELDFPCPTRRISFFETIDFKAYDLIHSHLFRPDVYCAYHKKKIRKAGAKLLTTVHTAIYDDLGYTYGKLVSMLLIFAWRAAWKRMDHAVVLTSTAQKYYQSIEFKSLSVINNGRELPKEYADIPEEDQQAIDLLKKNYQLLGTVCAINKRKGLEQILALLKIQKDYAFIVVGDGNDRTRLEALALKYKVAERFKIIGSRANGYRYIPNFDIYVLPSRSEGLPLALLEAMALKVPVVCSRIPVFLDTLNSAICSFFELDNTAALQDACSLALSNGSKQADLAFDHYKIFFTANQMELKYRKLYESLLNRFEFCKL